MFNSDTFPVRDGIAGFIQDAARYAHRLKDLAEDWFGTHDVPCDKHPGHFTNEQLIGSYPADEHVCTECYAEESALIARQDELSRISIRKFSDIFRL